MSVPIELDGKPMHLLGDGRYWGNDFSVKTVKEDGARIFLCIFRSAAMKPGDYLAVPHDPTGRTYALYEIESIWTPSDLGDQHFVWARHRPMVAEDITREGSSYE